MKLDLKLVHNETNTVYTFNIDLPSMNYTYDRVRNIGLGNWRTTLTDANSNNSMIVTISLRVIPRFNSETEIKLVYYVFLSAKSLSNQDNSIQVTEFILDHTDKFYNIGKVPLLDTYPIFLFDSQYLSSTVEVNYVYRDLIIIPSDSNICTSTVSMPTQ